MMMKRTSNTASATTNGSSNTRKDSHKKYTTTSTTMMMLWTVMAFFLGCFVTATLILNVQLSSVDPQEQHRLVGATTSTNRVLSTMTANGPAAQTQQQLLRNTNEKDSLSQSVASSNVNIINDTGSILQGIRILVVLVAFDFSQIPHLEEVVDGYHDVCTAGAGRVDVHIHTTLPWPVPLLDLWNTRFPCPAFSVRIVIKPKHLRLHLVDCHRQTFYDHIDDYDLFIYSEDDIRVRPTTVASYLWETQRIQQAMHAIQNDNNKQSPSAADYNVGIVRYEYNYPANVVIDDNTRHATQNVTRVYWEHSGFKRPVWKSAIEPLSRQPSSFLTEQYVTMKNHHQGMFLATRELLLAWKERCDFHIASNRPGRGSQPTEGTQRVWMSSQMLYGKRHCNVQQVLPKDAFSTLTVLHLPNKNYRRVGKYRNRKFADGSEVFEQPHASLLTAMEVHLALRQALPNAPQFPYRGIQMIDDVVQEHDRFPLLDQRMKDYEAYVQRGGVLSADDMTKVELVPAEDETTK